MHHLLEDFRRNYTNVPMYQSGSGGENALVIVGEENVVMISTYEHADIIITFMDKERLKQIKPTDLFDEADYHTIEETLEGNPSDFGRVFLNNLDVLHDKKVIFQETIYRREKPCEDGC